MNPQRTVIWLALAIALFLTEGRAAETTPASPAVRPATARPLPTALREPLVQQRPALVLNRPVRIATGRPAVLGQIGPGGNALGNAPRQEGTDLLDLIQETISPNSWEARGGNGVIRYFPGRRAIVVRQ